MSDAKAVINYLNGITLHTISEIEKLLLSLPQAGNKCNIQIVKPLNNRKLGKNGRGTADVVTPGSMEIRDMVKPLSLSPKSNKTRSITESSDAADTSSSSTSFAPQRNVECRTINSVREEMGEDPAKSKCCKSVSSCKLTPKYRIKTEKIKISPLVSIYGVVLDIDVEITLPESGDKKVVKLEIECPNYVPARIRVGGKWKNIG